jgi:hypothetical protein
MTTTRGLTEIPAPITDEDRAVLRAFHAMLAENRQLHADLSSANGSAKEREQEIVNHARQLEKIVAAQAGELKSLQYENKRLQRAIAGIRALTA